MPDYQQGKIYKIECLTTGKVYIGSTTQKKLSQRLAEHVRHYKMFLENKFVYMTSYEVLKEGHYQITLVKLFLCNIHDELLMEERKTISEYDCVNNRKHPISTIEEQKALHNTRNQKYYYSTIEYQQLRKKIYNENNKEKVSEYRKNYEEKHKQRRNEYKKEWERRKRLYLQQLQYYNI